MVEVNTGVEVGSGFSISQEQATVVRRELDTGSGTGAYWEPIKINKLISHLEIDDKIFYPPERTASLMFLIAYVNTSTRYIGILKKEDPRAVKDKILQQLSIPDGENSYPTLVRLSDIAIENSKTINPQESLKTTLGPPETSSSSSGRSKDATLETLLTAYIKTTTSLIWTLKGEDPAVINDKIHQQLAVPDRENSQQTFERLLNIAMENSNLINPPVSS